MVESSEQDITSWSDRHPGIMVTVATSEHDNFAALGFAVDQIEHIITQWFSGKAVLLFILLIMYKIC